MTVDARSFRDALACFASGITVVTAGTASGQRAGLTVSAFSSLSLAPPLILVCLDRSTTHLDAFVAGPFAVNVLREDQKDLSNRFSTRNGDKWAGMAVETSDRGLPILPGCLAVIECSVETTYDGGDHVIIVGRVMAVSHGPGGRPLLYYRSAYAGLGDPL